MDQAVEALPVRKQRSRIRGGALDAGCIGGITLEDGNAGGVCGH